MLLRVTPKHTSRNKYIAVADERASSKTEGSCLERSLGKRLFLLTREKTVLGFGWETPEPRERITCIKLALSSVVALKDAPATL